MAVAALLVMLLLLHCRALLALDSALLLLVVHMHSKASRRAAQYLLVLRCLMRLPGQMVDHGIYEAWKTIYDEC